MRVPPDGFIPALRAQWMACVMHDLLGLSALSGAPAVRRRLIVGHPALKTREGRCVTFAFSA
jgi:hypothetical protein